MPLIQLSPEDGTRQLLALGLIVALTTGVLGTVLAPDHAVQIIGFSTLGFTQLVILFQAQRATAKAQEAKDAANVGVEVGASTNEKVNNINSLVNGAHGKVLYTLHVALQRIAELTGKPDDKAEADLAKEQWLNHEAKAHGIRETNKQ